MPTTQQDVQNAFQALNDSLTNAYWAASTIVDKDRIRGAADAVNDILTALTEEDIRSRTADFQSVKVQVDAVSEKLKTLQAEIDTIIHNIAIATTVVGAITKALAAASSFFGG